MQRKLTIVMILTAILAAEGCRRGGGEKKPPININRESDLLFNAKKNELAESTKPIIKSKTIKIDFIDPLGGAPGFKWEWPEGAFDPNNIVQFREARENDEADSKLIEIARKAYDAEKDRRQKKEADEADLKRRKETDIMGKYLVTYRKAKKATEYSYDDLKKDLRRQKRFDMYNDLAANSIEVVYLASTAADQLLCYHTTPEEKIGHASFFADGKLDMLKKDDIDMRIKKQELFAAWQYYTAWATPHFYRVGPEFEQFRPFMSEPPPTFLKRIELRKPELLKNPPDARNLDRFKKYLGENAPPHLRALVENTSLQMDMNVNLRDANVLVASRNQPEQKGEEKTHLSITTDPQFVSITPDQFKVWVGQFKK